MGIVFVGMALLLAALATADGLKFTLLTSPPKYLKRFPLDQVSKQDLIGELGAPAEQATVEGPITGSIPTARAWA